MRTTRYLFTVIGLAALGLTACNSEDEPQNGGTLPDGAVHITATIEGMQTRANIHPDTGAGSFEVDDVWGLYTFTGDAANPSYSKENIEHYADNRDKLLWEKLGEGRITFSAHYPRQTGEISNPTAYRFTPPGIFEDDDLLFATATQSNGGTVNLTFKHLMHRLVINLQAGQGVTDDELSNATIETINQNDMESMKGIILVNLLTGELSSPDGSMYYRAEPKFDKIVVPQTLTAGDGWLTITIGPDVWYYNVPADLNTTEPGNQTRLESGQRLTLNLTLKKTSAGGNEVELTSSGIGGWNEQPTIEDDVTIPGTTGTITADQVKAALTGTDTAPIVIDGDLTLSLDTDIRLGADHTLTINPGATLTISDVNGEHIYLENHTLTINGGGTVLFKESDRAGFGISSGTLKLGKSVTVNLKGGYIDNCAIEVGADATIVLDNPMREPIVMSTNPLTVKGKIHIKDFWDAGISSAGTILIDGGTISIEGHGTAAIPGITACALISYSRLEIANGGSLVSTVTYGGVRLSEGSKVKGASGLFETSTYELETDNEVTVGSSTDIYGLKGGVYKRRMNSNVFCWESAQ